MPWRLFAFFWFLILTVGLVTTTMGQDSAMCYSRFQAPDVLEIRFEVDPRQAVEDTEGNGGSSYGLSDAKLILVSPDGEELLVAEGLEPFMGNYMVPSPTP
jgi:hypothetical protein